MIEKVLVANRGEIARRVFRTCREMGIATVAVYSEPDRDAPFVREADESVPLQGAVPADTYLRGETVIAAALLVGADAIHPGYGFLSENAGFARLCAEAGIIFIGPSVEAIELMGSKLGARELMQIAGVPVLTGQDLTGLNESGILAAADQVGWPILVKASYGGGGRGMRVVRETDGLLDAVSSAKREAMSAFGNETVFLERYVDNPRHVEIQIFGDQHGSIVHLNERECSIQRRHQKIIEESPSPAVAPELRDQMGQAAVTAGKTLGYVGAGTVEFLLAPTGDFYFLEVNTRLQVEHPVTELVTGLDLVRLQLAVAQGDPLPPEAYEPPILGHAIEVRLYAEDPLNDFLPSAGRLSRFDVPISEGIRLDSGVEDGDVVSTNYDPMLAKVIAFAPTRAEAARRLARTLRRTRVHGVTTNRSLLVGILEERDFLAGAIDTHYLERNTPADLVGTVDSGEVVLIAAIAAAVADQADRRRHAKVLATLPSGFRNHHSELETRRYAANGRELLVGYRLGRAPHFEVDGAPLDITLLRDSPDEVDLVVAGIRRTFRVSRAGGEVYVDSPQTSTTFTALPRFPDPADHLEPGSLLAPMPGTVVRIAVAEGESVTAGQIVLVMEAMKMEHTITAPTHGIVASIPVTIGKSVDSGQLLAVLQADEEVAG